MDALSRLVSEASSGAGAGAPRALAEFVEFLDDEKPPLLVADSLTFVLRTEPPAPIGAARVAEIVAVWADARGRYRGRRTSDMMLEATRRILDAARARTIKEFDAIRFYGPFVEGLAARCPEPERAAFEAGLRPLRDLAANTPFVHEEPAAEPEPAAAVAPDVLEIHDMIAAAEPPAAASGSGATGPLTTVVVGGREMSHNAAVAELVGQFEGAARMSDDQFATAIADLDRVFMSRAGIPVRQTLTRLAVTAAGLFNEGRVRRAGRLFDLVKDLAVRLNVSANDWAMMLNDVPFSRLDATVLGRLAGDTQRETAISAMMRVFPDLELEAALDALEVEGSRDRRRFLLKAAEMRGTAMLGPVLVRLTARGATSMTWYVARNLIYLCSRVEPDEEVDRRRVIAAVSPFVTTDNPQVRSISVAALKRAGGRKMTPEVVPHLARAFDASVYWPPLSASGNEDLKRHLSQVIDALVMGGLEPALVLLAEVATGARGESLGLGHWPRDAAVGALAKRRAPLPRRAALVVVDHLRRVQERRVKLVLGNLGLGVDVAACRALVGLVADSTEPEARDLLGSGLMKRLAASR